MIYEREINYGVETRYAKSKCNMLYEILIMQVFENSVVDNFHWLMR